MSSGLRGARGIALLVFFPLASHAQLSRSNAELWRHPSSVRVEAHEMAFTDQEFPSTKNEGVFFLARFNQGWVLLMNLFRFQNALFYRWGIYASVTDPSGAERWAKYELDTDAVRFDTTRLWVSDGRNSVEEEGSAYRVRFGFPGFACDLRFDNTLPPWKAGSGLTVLSPDGTAFDLRAVVCPWARVSGWIDTGQGPMGVTGDGYAEKSLTVNSLTRLNPLLYSLRLYSAQDAAPAQRWHLQMLDMVTHKAYGGTRLPRLGLANGGAWVFTAPEYELEPLDYRRERETGYEVPTRLRLDAQWNGYRLRGEYRAAVLFNVTDVMSEVPSWLRAILLLFLKRPIYFRYLGEFVGRLTYPDGREVGLRLSGPYEYVVVR